MSPEQIKALFPTSSASLLRVNAAARVETAKPGPDAATGQEDEFKQPPNAYVGKERDLHGLFITDMNRRGAHCFYSRTDTAASIEPGLPDVHVMFTGADGICRGMAVEFKCATGRVKERQQEKIAEMRAKRIPVIVAWDLATAINFARAMLGC